MSLCPWAVGGGICSFASYPIKKLDFESIGTSELITSSKINLVEVEEIAVRFEFLLECIIEVQPLYRSSSVCQIVIHIISTVFKFSH